MSVAFGEVSNEKLYGNLFYTVIFAQFKCSFVATFLPICKIQLLNSIIAELNQKLIE